MTAEAPALRVTPPDFFADPALRAVLAAVPEARVVGGAVRDALLGLTVADIDLATPCPPDGVIAALRRAGLGAAPTGIAHGTVTAIAAGRGFEITTLRRDVATDGRHAVVAFTADWRADAARRDFTLNALSMTPDGAVYDYWDGLADLRAGRVRFVGDPAARIAEDYLRILRFFRFFARYARQPPDPATLAALRAGVPGLARLAPERVWKELAGLLSAPDPGAAVALMADLGVLAAVLTEGTAPARLARLLTAGAPADPLLRLAALVGRRPGGAGRAAAPVHRGAHPPAGPARRTGPAAGRGRGNPASNPGRTRPQARSRYRPGPHMARRRRNARLGRPANPPGGPAPADIPAGRTRRPGTRRAARPRRGRPAGRDPHLVARHRMHRRPRRLPGPAGRAGDGGRRGRRAASKARGRCPLDPRQGLSPWNPFVGSVPVGGGVPAGPGPVGG